MREFDFYDEWNVIFKSSCMDESSSLSSEGAQSEHHNCLSLKDMKMQNSLFEIVID